MILKSGNSLEPKDNLEEQTLIGSEKEYVVVFKREEGSSFPFKATFGAACFDLFTPVEIMLEPGETKKVSTGISLVSMPEDLKAMIYPRSSTSLRGIMVYTGVIDSDYCGEIGVLLFNASKQNQQFNAGDRFAQLSFERVEKIIIKSDDGSAVEQKATKRSGGLGSTGA